MTAYSRREFLGVAGKFGAGVALAGRGSGIARRLFEGESAPHGARQAAAKTLHIAISGNIETRDPFKSDFANSNEVNDFNLYDQFFNYGARPSGQRGVSIADTSLIKGLTTDKWQLAPNNLSILLNVRPGMKFHRTLNPVTADDVIFFLDRAMNTPGTGPNAFLGLANVKGYQKTGPMQVKIDFSAPSPWFFQLFFQDNMGLYDSVDVKKHATRSDPYGANYIATTDVASGPYEVASYDPESQIVLRAFPQYWGPAPHFQQVIVSFVVDESERVLLLRTGSIDIAEELGSASLDSLRDVPGVRIVDVPSANQAIMGLNVTKPPFNDERVRQALAYAIPYQQIVSEVLGGHARVSKGVVPLVDPYHDSSTYPWTYDPSKAKQLLASAGHPNGFSFSVIYETGNTTDQQLLVYMQTALREIGIQMSLEEMTEAAFSTAINTLSAREAYYTEVVWFVQDPGYIARFVGNSATVLYPTGFKNARVDGLVKAMDFVVSDSTLSRKKQQLASEYQRIVNGAAVYLTLGDLNFQRAMRSDISGFVLYPNLETRYRDLT